MTFRPRSPFPGRPEGGATGHEPGRRRCSPVPRVALFLVLLVAGLSVIALPSIAGAVGGTLTAVSEGDLTTCAVDAGNAYCWGLDTSGELGNGTDTSSESPVEVVDVDGSGALPAVSAISEGATTTCAISAAHAYCWGYDGSGELGNGSATKAAHKSPVEVKTTSGTGHLSTVTAISTGYLATCAVSSGHAYCWGLDNHGQLGNGTETSSTTPVEVKTTAGTGHLSTVTAVSEGTTATCAVSSGHVYCWGTDRYGQLGNGTATTSTHETPVEVVGVGDSGDLSTVSAISEGFWTTCALSAGHAYCWGHDNYGQLGNGTATPDAHDVPDEVTTAAGTGYLSTVTAISAGPTNSSCAVSAGNAYCWGLNSSGELGNGTETNSRTPAEVVGVGDAGDLSSVTAISAGTFTTCAVISGRNAYCWGLNSSGQLGNGTETSSTTPVEVAGVGGFGHLGTTTTVYGTTADGTAAAEFTRAFPYTAGSCPPSRAAVVATTATYQDALSSQYLAQSLTTGTLLTPTTTLSSETVMALEEEGISSVDIVGGPLAVSNTVEAAIEALTAYACGGTHPSGKITVQRIDGQTAYGTAEAVAEHVGPGSSLSLAGAYSATNTTGGTGRYNDTAGKGTAAPSGSVPTAILATAQGFQDAQSASVIAYHAALPLLMTAPDTLSTTAVAAIETLGIKQVILMGGQEAVSNTVEAALVQETGVSVLRIAGTDYTDTAAELAKFEDAKSTAGLGWTPGHRVMVARGDFFSDGIAGAVLDSQHNTATGAAGTVRPLLLTENPSEVGTFLTAFLNVAGHTGIDETAAKHITALTVLGGPLAVSTTAISAMEHDLTT